MRHESAPQRLNGRGGPRRGLRSRAAIAVAALAVAVGGQITAGGPVAASGSADTGNCPCSVFPSDSTPGIVDSGDPYRVVLGVKVTPTDDGYIDGVKFYKSAANTGTHTGSLWTSDGTLLATGTFSGETDSGWQTLMFATPVPVKPGSTYVASYYAPNGHYSYNSGYFLYEGTGEASITAPSNTASGGNGVYTYYGASAFPNFSYNAANYWVDVVFDDAGVPNSAPTVTATSPGAGATGVAATSAVTATFSAQLDTGTLHFNLTDAAGTRVPGAVTYDAASSTAKFTPDSQLPAGTTFTATVQASDGWGHPMDAPHTWSFTTGTTPPAYTCPCSLFSASATPAVANSNDPNSVEIGVRFIPAINGKVTGIRFYKGALNTGTHTGSLWSADGTQLATGTFADETATGWQTLTFATPVTVTAGTTYVASYHAPVGNYSYTTGYFSYQHLVYPLAAPTTNGSYDYGNSSAFPGSAANGTNYWVDAIFAAS